MPKSTNETIHITNVPPEVKQRAQIIAIRDGKPLSEILREILEEWVQEREQGQQTQKKGKPS